MALNFPTDTSSPYIAPSGVKYIWNTSVGAWEVAIQPPSIIDTGTPTTTENGFLWWDSDDEILYIYDGTEWVAAGGAGNAGTTVTVSATPPAVGNTVGDLWWDTVGGFLYVWYLDPDAGEFWVPTCPPADSASNAVVSGTSAPDEAEEGDLWLNTLTNILYVYHANNWVSTIPPSTVVNEVTASAPLNITGTTADPIIGVANTGTSNVGVIELATQAEVDAGAATNKAVTPATAKTIIENSTHTPAASEDTQGIVELATDAEAVSGTDTERAVTSANVEAALASLDSGIAAGTIITYAGNSAPADWFECDGSAVSRTTYADLYAVVGDTYGAGDGSTTFNLPDLRGEFLRGWDDGRGVDSGRVLGSSQSSDNKGHSHTASVSDPGHFHYVQTAPGSGLAIRLVNNGSTQWAQTGSATTNVSVSNSTEGSSEFRPRNIALMYCIKH